MLWAEDGAEEDGEQQQIADDADRPRPDLATHTAEGAGEAEDVADDLADEERLPAGQHPLRVEGVDQPAQQFHRVSLRSRLLRGR